VGPLDRAAANELERRVQLEQLATQVRPEELQSFIDIGMEQLKRLSVGPWHDAISPDQRSALLDLQQRLPHGIVRDLLARKSQGGVTPEMMEQIRRGSIQQTAPGQGAGGSPTLPAPGPNTPGSGNIPILPMPDTASAQGGSGLQCATPRNTSVNTPSSEEFMRQNRATAGPSGTAIPYCQDGFSDVVLLDRAEPGHAAPEQICSGVRIGQNWVLTAGHCVKHWTESAGRIFGLPAGRAKCLDALPDAYQKHPGELCDLPVLKRAGPAEIAPKRDDLDVDLALVPIAPGNGSDNLRTASLTRIDASKPFEVTLPGFGILPGKSAGRLRVGWSKMLAPTALAALTTGRDGDGNSLRFVPIQFVTADYGRDRLVSWSCGGDSGAPLMAGRVFGYANEDHNVAAIVAEGSITKPEDCRQDAAAITKVVSVLEPTVSKWLCGRTNACR
jgi:hypothetical protein